MRAPRLLMAALLVTGVVGAVTVGADGAGAANTKKVPHFTGSAGGSYITGVDGRVTSGRTAASGIDTLKPGTTSSNSAASVTVPVLGNFGAVTTGVEAAKTSTGYLTTAHAKTTGLSLLGGLISADVLDTRAYASLVNGSQVGDANTTVTNLTISGTTEPTNVAKNTTVTIPGVADITVNYSASEVHGPVFTEIGAAIVITLLTAQGTAPAGSTIVVNPVRASISLVGAGFQILSGHAFATRANASVAGTTALLGATGATSVPSDGTKGQDVSNNTAGVDLAPVVTASAAGSTANGLATDNQSYAQETVQISGLNLFGGLITASTLKATAYAAKQGKRTPTASVSATFVDLVVNGTAIPANVAPNTVIDVAGLGTVTLNQQRVGKDHAYVRLIDVVLTVARDGLPVGAEVEVAFADAGVGR